MNRLTHMLPPNNGSVSLMLRDQCMHHQRYAIMVTIQPIVSVIFVFAISDPFMMLGILL